MKFQTKHIPLAIGIGAFLIYFIIDLMENKKIPEDVLNRYIKMSDDELYNLNQSELDQIINKSKYIQNKYNETTKLLNRIKTVNDKRSTNIPQYTPSVDKNITEKDIENSIEHWDNAIDDIINKFTPDIDMSEEYSDKTYAKILKSNVEVANEILYLYKNLRLKYPDLFTEDLYNNTIQKAFQHFKTLAKDYASKSKTKIDSILEDKGEIIGIVNKNNSDNPEIISENSKHKSDISSENSEHNPDISSDDTHISSEKPEHNPDIVSDDTETIELPKLGKYQKQCVTCGDIIPLNPNNRKLCNKCKELRTRNNLDQATFIEGVYTGEIEVNKVYPKLKQRLV